MASARGSSVAVGLASLAWCASAEAQLIPHDCVQGVDVERVRDVYGDPRGAPAGQTVEWGRLSTMERSDTTALLFYAPAGTAAVEVPACANVRALEVDHNATAVQALRPKVLDLPRDGREHVLVLRIDVSAYEHRVACSYPPRFGTREKTLEGLDEFSFPSAHAREGGGKAVVFIPKGHDTSHPSALLVGLHPWNGSIWTYAAYAELLREANAKDVVLLMPSGLGNSLYTEQAETEVMSAIDELSRVVAIDPRRVSIWGASMGGAGATTIGFHHPDRFAAITSFFGDSKYDLNTYVKAILHDQDGAHRVNAFDIAENARNVPVWLIHGEADTVSPIAQSAMLASALRKLGFAVRFDRVPGMGHSGMLVTKFIAEVVDRAAETRIPEAPKRVSFVKVGPYDGSAYGIRFTRSGGPGDAAIDLELQGDTVHVLRARGVKSIAIPRGAFGLSPKSVAPVVVDDTAGRGVDVHWDALP
jgi:pimeloyl-ACP methyl ester carboxylesterase